MANGKIRDSPRCRDPSKKSEPENLWWKFSRLKKVKNKPWKNETSRLIKNASEILRSCQNFPRPTFLKVPSAPLNDHQDNQQIFRSAQGNDTLEIGNCASSQIRGSLQPVCLLLSCYPDNYVMRYMYYHQSVGVISQSFLNLWHLLHSGYKRHKLTWSFTFSL